MKFSSFSRSTEDLTITLQNDIPIENVGTIKYYQDNASGIFSKKEFRWSFNNEYWSSWQTLTQVALTAIDTYVNYYFFLQIRYTLTAVGSGTVTTFELNYLNGTAVAVTPRILTEDIQHLDASAVLIHDILQTYEVVTIRDASLLNGYSGNYYLDRQHHVGHQTISSITGLQAILDNTATVGAYVKEASLGTDFTWVNGLLDVSVTSGYSTTYIDGSLNAKTDFTYTVKQDVSIGLKADKTYVDTSLNNLGIKDANIDTSLNALWVKEGNQDSSLLLYVKKAGDTMTGNLTINSSLFVNGNVGIGTNSPTKTLDVSGNFHTTGNARIDSSLGVKTAYIYTDATSGYATLLDIRSNNGTALSGGDTNFTGTLGTLKLRTYNIGTTIPSIRGSAFFQDTGGLMFLTQANNESIFFGTNYNYLAPQMVLNSAGKLGVGGIQNPSTYLDVSGNFHTTGAAWFDGSLNIKNQRIIGIANPIDSSDAVNKYYVDSSFGLKIDVDTSLNSIWTKFTNIDASLNLKTDYTYTFKQDASIALKTNFTYSLIQDASIALKTNFTYSLIQDASIALKADKSYVDASLVNIRIQMDSSFAANELWMIVYAVSL